MYVPMVTSRYEVVFGGPCPTQQAEDSLVLDHVKFLQQRGFCLRVRGGKGIDESGHGSLQIHSAIAIGVRGGIGISMCLQERQ